MQKFKNVKTTFVTAMQCDMTKCDVNCVWKQESVECECEDCLGKHKNDKHKK